MKKETKEGTEKEIERLYNLNANISLHYIGIKGNNPTLKIMEEMNKTLGEIIKNLRELMREEDKI